MKFSMAHRQIEWVKNWLKNGQKPVANIREFSFSLITQIAGVSGFEEKLAID
ncbi:MAG: hypothetical protein KKB50_22325 [Planctomycetes bacterium]|nr:hypothetical protein [Planctomycetota bacterium]